MSLPYHRFHEILEDVKGKSLEARKKLVVYHRTVQILLLQDSP